MWKGGMMKVGIIPICDEEQYSNDQGTKWKTTASYSNVW